ncbi:MAG: hypothetical protein ACJ8LL_07240 [Candidatus Udaeobacter sp.]
MSEDDAATGPAMYVGTMDVYLNRWFATYEEARAARQFEGGYLFPYKHHFFIARAEAVRELGLDPADSDWERIGWDWVRPHDVEAWQRLKEKREQAA